MISAINKTKQPNKVIVFIDNQNRDSLEGLIPYISFFPINKSDEPIVYVCQNYSCQLPTSDINSVIDMLD